MFYARPGGSSIREVLFPLDGGPNGVGLSPDGRRLEVAETFTGPLWSWDLSWDLAGPGEVVPVPGSGTGGTLLGGLPGMQLFDSLPSMQPATCASRHR